MDVPLRTCRGAKSIPVREIAMRSDDAIDMRVGKQNAHRVPDHIRAAHGVDGATLLDVVRGMMFRVNVAGSRILELLEQGLGEPEIAALLEREFGIERGTAEADVREFVEVLIRQRLLTARDVVPSPRMGANPCPR